ncbi:MAG: hypothetical protein KAK00_00345 [Nanoarchaeota archaeon]|nr:hypothetical protein [Nanoarchaeota archaeon]
MTDRIFKVGDVISMAEIELLSSKYLLRAITNDHSLGDCLKPIKLKIVALPEVD